MTDKEKIQLAAKILEIPLETAEKYCGLIPKEKAMYFSIPEKGGGSLIVGDDGSVLYADSSVGYEKHLKAYQQGIRTNLR